jgi:hypothetical protein
MRMAKGDAYSGERLVTLYVLPGAIYQTRRIEKRLKRMARMKAQR